MDPDSIDDLKRSNRIRTLPHPKEKYRGFPDIKYYTSVLERLRRDDLRGRSDDYKLAGRTAGPDTE